MNILVCMKQILDPEVPARDFRVDASRKEAERGSASLVTNIFCENALETALQFRDRIGGGKITALSFGAPSAEDTLRKALAMKADAAALVVDESGENHNPLTVARVLAAAIRKLGDFDLILTGRESGDWGAGQTGGLLAEELGLPCVSFADSLEKADALRIKRQTESGWEVVEAQTPVVVTITNDEHNVPRIPKVRDVMMAHRQPLTKWTAAELGVEAAEYYEVVELAIPQKESRCELVAGDTLDQKVDALARRLVEVTDGSTCHPEPARHLVAPATLRVEIPRSARDDTVAIVFGSIEDRSAQGLHGAASALGSPRVVVVDDYQPEPVLDALAEACRGARVILLGNDTYSQEVAPRLAHRLGGAAVGDGTDVRLVDGRVRVTRQVYGGKAQAVIEVKREPAVVWLRARSFAPLPIGVGQAFLPVPTDRNVCRTRVVERHVAAESVARLEDARVIVSGGRGIGGPEGFHQELEPLAQLLGAQMAASRAACDAGWVPPTWQVGQTGKKVAPELYLAIAITGASQHMAGISEAKNIAAINIDPDAPIFKHARFGIVEDYRKVVPLLRRKLAELRG